MARLRILGMTATILATWNLVFPPNLTLAAPPGSAKDIHDIALTAGGTLQGRLLNRDGQPWVHQELRITKSDTKQTVTTRTDKDGNFKTTGLKGGIYRLDAAQSAHAFRFWASNTAPPSARSRLLMQQAPKALGQADDTIVRGQRQIGDIVTNPLVIGLVIAAAIAIPVAINNSKTDKPAGS